MSIRKNSVEHNLEEDSIRRPGELSSAGRSDSDESNISEISNTEEVEADYEEDLDEELTEDDFAGEEEEDEEDEA